MHLKSYFWQDLGSQDFAKLKQSGSLDKAVAVLPVAAIEQHGPHLPTGVDAFLVDGLVAEALRRFDKDEPSNPAPPIVFLPTQAVGKSDEHLAYPGTLSLSAQTTMAVWTELGAGVARAGIKKLLLFNSHGGQTSLMDIVARDLRIKHQLIVYSCNWFHLPLTDATRTLFSAAEHRFGNHAGDIETSMMLALRPDLVDMSQAKKFHSTSEDRAQNYPILGNGVSAKLAWQMEDYNVDGATGNAKNASAEKGRALISEVGQGLAQLLREISSLPLSTLSPPPSVSF
jgi:creatinine amidohydrolase